MTKTLTLDEMLDCLELMGNPLAASLARQLEAIGDVMAQALAAALNVEAGATRREESAFAGTCATFTPKHPGQVCPEPLASYDASEWDDSDGDEGERLNSAACTIIVGETGYSYHFEGDDDDAPTVYPTRAEAIRAANRVG